MGAVKKTASAGRKKSETQVRRAIVNITATFNNTIISITDGLGNTLSWSSPGRVGYKNSKQSSPFAANLAVKDAIKRAESFGVQNASDIEIRVKGPGSGRESAIRAVREAGLRPTLIKDVTAIPHNGTRPRKRRRV